MPSSPKPEGQQAAEGGATRKLDVRAEELRQQQEHDAFVAACLWQRIELVKGWAAGVSCITWYMVHTDLLALDYGRQS